MIRVKRVYDPPERGDGKRFLVERLWPRGMRKDALKMEGWVKEVAPSTELRQWFGHDPERWSEFRTRYRKELRGQVREENDKSNGLGQLLRAARKGNVTLLYSARDAEHNSALVLRDFLESKLEA
jgi:uncharacterized protein YeaO (DUF488 family)